MVDGKVAKVEEAITHPGVLPIDDPEGGAVVDEVRIQKVVMAEDR